MGLLTFICVSVLLTSAPSEGAIYYDKRFKIFIATWMSEPGRTLTTGIIPGDVHSWLEAGFHLDKSAIKAYKKVR